MLKVEDKAELMQKFGKHEKDSGSAEVQIAIFDARIRMLQEHLNKHKHDQSSRRGLLRLVGKRRSYLAYLRQNHPDRYRQILLDLNLRR